MSAMLAEKSRKLMHSSADSVDSMDSASVGNNNENTLNSAGPSSGSPSLTSSGALLADDDGRSLDRQESVDDKMNSLSELVNSASLDNSAAKSRANLKAAQHVRPRSQFVRSNSKREINSSDDPLARSPSLSRSSSAMSQQQIPTTPQLTASPSQQRAFNLDDILVNAPLPPPPVMSAADEPLLQHSTSRALQISAQSFMPEDPGIAEENGVSAEPQMQQPQPPAKTTKSFVKKGIGVAMPGKTEDAHVTSVFAFDIILCSLSVRGQAWVCRMRCEIDSKKQLPENPPQRSQHRTVSSSSR